ncbi:MAG: hypothetical protein IH577_00160 [Deltaproteobacteria bacterium]|nr:hypothetical protein [Deltaproteobacteria bacterium]
MIPLRFTLSGIAGPPVLFGIGREIFLPHLLHRRDAPDDLPRFFLTPQPERQPERPRRRSP